MVVWLSGGGSFYLPRGQWLEPNRNQLLLPLESITRGGSKGKERRKEGGRGGVRVVGGGRAQMRMDSSAGRSLLLIFFPSPTFSFILFVTWYFELLVTYTTRIFLSFNFVLSYFSGLPLSHMITFSPTDLIPFHSLSFLSVPLLYRLSYRSSPQLPVRFPYCYGRLLISHILSKEKSRHSPELNT